MTNENEMFDVGAAVDAELALLPDETPETSEARTDEVGLINSLKEKITLDRATIQNKIERQLEDEFVRGAVRRAEMAEATRDNDKPLVYTASALRAAGKAAGDPFRVEGFWPIGGRMNIFAQPKVGKSTLMGELVYCLLTGEPFLGEQETRAIEGSVCVIDVELTDREALTVYETVLDWTEANNADDRFVFASLEGRASIFNVTDSQARRELAEQYKGHDVYILDCAGPLSAALGLDENSNTDVQRLLSGFDEFVRLAGGTGAESVVVHHAGKTSGAPRGATAWEGSGSSNVILTADSLTSPRYIEVRGGRGEMFREKRQINPQGGRLVMGQKAAKRGASAESQFKPLADDPSSYVLDYIKGHDGEGRRSVITGAHQRARSQGISRSAVEEALDTLVEDGQVLVEQGDNARSKRAHHLADDSQGGIEPLEEPLL